MPERKQLLKLAGLLLGLSFFGWIIKGAIEQSQTVVWPPLPVPELAMTLLLVLIAHGLHGLAWTVGARQVAPRLNWTQGIAAYSISFLGRYIPGKIWQVGGLSMLTRNRGADPLHIAGYSLVFLVAFQVLGALVLTEAWLLQDFQQAWLICLLGAPLTALVLAMPFHFLGTQLTKILPRKVRDQLIGSLHQPFSALLINLTLLTIVWVLLASCGNLLALGFAPEWDSTWSQSAMATIGGLVAGFLVLIAPSGAGVRESTISLWLANLGIAPITTIAIVIALRIIMTAGDLLWATAGLLLTLRTSPTSPPD